MASSRVCSIDTCKRPVRALCICCQQNLCIDHLKEHSDLINAQLVPLADEINTLFDQFNNLSSVSATFFTDLDAWREQAHLEVDRFYQTKRQQFQEFVQTKQNRWGTELDRLRKQVNELIRLEEATQEHIDSINDSIRSLQQQTKQFQLGQFIRSPLVIDDLSVVIQLNKSTEDDLLPLSPPYRTMKLNVVWSSIAASEKYLLVIQDDQARLFDRQLIIQKQIPWTNGIIYDTFWSATLKRFVLVTPRVIFTLDQKTMTIKPCLTITDVQQPRWCRGTCSHDTLFLSTNNWGPFIYTYTLLPSIDFIQQFSSPVPCAKNESIDGLSSNNVALALVIVNHQREKWRLDLCSPRTFQRQWSVYCDSVLILNSIRCRSLSNNQWMVIASNTSSLFLISENGKLIKRDNYPTTPRHAVQLDDDVLAVLTNDAVHLHHLS